MFNSTVLHRVTTDFDPFVYRAFIEPQHDWWLDGRNIGFRFVVNPTRSPFIGFGLSLIGLYGLTM